MAWCCICAKFEEAASDSSHAEHVCTGAAAKFLGEREMDTLGRGREQESIDLEAKCRVLPWMASRKGIWIDQSSFT